MQINKITKIEHATLGKRFIAFFIDAVLTLFVALGLFVGFGAIFSNVDSVKEMKVKFNNIITESNVMKVEDNKSLVKEFDTYEEYVENYYTFYNEFLPKYNEEKKPINNYWFNVFVLGLDDINNTYTEETLSNRSGAITTGKDIFEYRVVEGETKYDLIGIPKAYNQGQKGYKDLTDDERIKVMSYFYNGKDDNSSASYFCVLEISKIPELNELYNDYALWDTTVPLLLALLVGYLIFFFIIPMCLRDGKTFGKQFLKLSVVSKDYYSVKRSQIVLRYLPQSLLFVVAALFLGINAITIGLGTFIVLGSYCMAIFRGNHESIHDVIAGTYVVSDELSLWFKNPEEEAMEMKKKEEIVG